MNKYEEIIGLKYAGRAFESSIVILGSNRNIALKRNQTYTFEKMEKIKNEQMYDYYRQFEGFSFLIGANQVINKENNINDMANFNSTEEVKSKPTKETKPIEEVKEIKLEPKKEKVEPLPSDVEQFDSDKEFVKDIIAQSEGKDISTVKSSTGSEVKASSISDDELKEILDMSFEEDQLHSMLKDLGINADDSASKSFLINKLVEQDRDFVINTINKK